MTRTLKFFYIFLILLGMIACTLEPRRPSSPPLKGMALGLFSKEANFDYTKDLVEMKALGVNSILLNVSWFQANIQSNEISPRAPHGQNEFTLPDATLIAIIDEAHRQGMSVLLFPYLRFDRLLPNEWRGVLKPQNFETWSRNYENFILHYAKLAEAHQVALFSVGSELGSLEEKNDFWLPLIQKIRQKYHGKLLYSANWDHYRYPTFWDHLDYIAMTSYFELSQNLSPSYEELAKSWQRRKKEILKFKAQYPQKVILSEVGYPSLDGSAKYPWNYYASTQPDPDEQALCYQAFIEAWSDTPDLEGVYWWIWYGEGGPTDLSYTPRGKPAANLVKSWYGK